MAETLNGILAERRGEGQKFYVEGMQKSGPDKAKILPYVAGGVIVEGGPGSGVVTDLMREKFPESEIYAVDISGDMIRRLNEKFSSNSKIHVVKHDIVNYDPGIPVDTYVHVSNIHEVYSVGGYEAVKAMLANEYEHTRNGGRIVIRDGVQPSQETVYVKPQTEFGVERFFKFVEGFKAVRNVRFEIGRLDPENLHWKPSNSQNKIKLGESFIKLYSKDASELFSKYFYPEMNLAVELTEQFGIWTLEEYQAVLRKVGYRIVHAESYLIQFLLENHYAIDYGYYRLDKNGVPSNSPYPDSTAILVGEK